MSDRLSHLQRQQALLREHLAWIESEIAAESGKSAPSPLAPILPSSQPRASAPPSLPVSSTGSITAAPPAEVDALIEQYATTERQNPADIRRGCFLVFTAAFLLLAGVVGAVWLLFYNN